MRQPSAFISQLPGGSFGLVLWGGPFNGLVPRTYTNAQAAAFSAVWVGRAREVWLDGKRMW